MEKQTEKEITIRDQIKKFALKSVIGFQTVQVYGLGVHLGIFDYLYKKGKLSDSSEKVSSISFTFDELKRELNLNDRYLDAWLQMALECGIFEIDHTRDRCLKTAIHVYDILIDKENMFYLGGTLTCANAMGLYQDDWVEKFKTGEVYDFQAIPEEKIKIDPKIVQSVCIGTSNQVMQLFIRRFKELKRVLRNGGSILEVGCGYGFNLEIWAKKFKNARIIGIDIDSEAISSTKEMVAQNNWNDRIEVIHIPINKFATSHKNEFDLIILCHVLHEMNPDRNYRLNVFKDLYSMLKDDGLLIVVEHMIPNLFAPKSRFMFFEIWHKYIETILNSEFYNENSFEEFIDSTPFKNAELIKERNDYFWAVTK